MSNSSSNDLEDHDAPNPPRFRWLRRLCILALLWVGLLAGLRVGWGWYADKQVQKELAAARARGRPIRPEDFDPPTVPEPRNAALTLRMASTQIVSGAQLITLDNSYYTSNPPSAADLRLLDAVVAQNRPMLATARQARSQSGVDWGVRMAHPPVMTLLPFANEARSVANMENYAAIDAHAHGDDREAIELVRDILCDADAIGRGPPFLIVQLVCFGIENLACDRIELLAPELRIEGSGDAGRGAPATRRQVRAVIDALLDETTFRRMIARAWDGERMTVLFSADDMGRGTLGPVIGRLLRPAIMLGAVRAVKRYDLLSQTTTQPSWPAAQAKLPPGTVVNGALPEQISRLMEGLMLQNTRPIMLKFRSLANRRHAAVVLAVRLYRLDHGGRSPESVRQLVPQYLPVVPTDPLSADGHPVALPARK